MDFHVTSWAFIFSIALALAGCETAQNPSSGAACRIFKPISYSRHHDTAATIDEIKQHNAVWMDGCQ